MTDLDALFALAFALISALGVCVAGLGFLTYQHGRHHR